MGLRSEYRIYREGGWNLLVLSERWSRELWDEILSHLGDTSPAAHPQTKRFHYPSGDNGEDYYLKIFHCSPPLGALKDLFRDSKAFRALKQGEALSERGFHVPLTVAAGEERSLRFLKRAFLLTLGVEGSPLPLFLQERCSLPLELSALRKKREYLKGLALEVRRLHQNGFVHGDLVPSNILVRAEEGGVTFFYMDNDRTRRYPDWLPHPLWRRNLVQLNRFVLTGISLQDRMRFLRFYFGERPRGASDRRLIRWLEKRTRKRRQVYGRAGEQLSFRELMSWKGSFTKNTR